MSTVLGVVMVLAAFVFVFWPLFKTSSGNDLELQPEEDARLSDLRQEKDRLFATISELDSDYEMGNLSQKDHQELRQRYEEKAVSAIKQLDTLATEVDQEPDSDIGEAIEQQVIKLRSHKAAATPTAQAAPAVGNICPGCGVEIDRTAKFCPGCGMPAARFCPNCGAKRAPKVAFCSQCGARLDGRAGGTKQ